MLICTVILSLSGSSPAQSIDRSFLPADRITDWKPGMMGVGGIPVRSTVCAALPPWGNAR